MWQKLLNKFLPKRTSLSDKYSEEEFFIRKIELLARSADLPLDEVQNLFKKWEALGLDIKNKKFPELRERLLLEKLSYRFDSKQNKDP
jgi:hypothetical protein